MIEKNLSFILSDFNYPIYPLVAPQDQEAPYLVYKRGNTFPTNTVKGTDRSVDNALFQIDIWTKDYLRLAEIADQIIDKIIENFGANALLKENQDDDYYSQPGSYHRILQFSLREKRNGGGS